MLSSVYASLFHLMPHTHPHTPGQERGRQDHKEGNPGVAGLWAKASVCWSQQKARTNDEIHKHSFTAPSASTHSTGTGPLLGTATTASRSRRSSRRSGSLRSPRGSTTFRPGHTMSASGPLGRSSSRSLGGSQRASHFRKPACALVRYFTVIIGGLVKNSGDLATIPRFGCERVLAARRVLSRAVELGDD